MPKKPPKQALYDDIYNLDSEPELAQALGNMVVAWARAETALVKTLSRLTGIGKNRALTAYYSIPTFQARIKFLRALVIEWDTNGFDKDAIDHVIKKLSALSGTRNHWIHGVWSRERGSGNIVVFDFRSLGMALDRRKPVKAHDIKYHVDTVLQRVHDLRVLIQHTTLPL